MIGLTYPSNTIKPLTITVVCQFETYNASGTYGTASGQFTLNNTYKKIKCIDGSGTCTAGTLTKNVVSDISQYDSITISVSRWLNNVTGSGAYPVSCTVELFN